MGTTYRLFCLSEPESVYVGKALEFTGNPNYLFMAAEFLLEHKNHPLLFASLEDIDSMPKAVRDKITFALKKSEDDSEKYRGRAALAEYGMWADALAGRAKARMGSLRRKHLGVDFDRSEMLGVVAEAKRTWGPRKR